MTERLSTTVTLTERQLTSDFATSLWLKHQIVETKKRDIIDARRDAELLLMVLEQRCIEDGIIKNNDSL